MKKKCSKKMAAVGMAVALSMSSSAFAGNHEGRAKAAAESQFKIWAHNAAVIGAIKMQNTSHASLSATDIDALDKKWRAEKKAGGGDLISSKLSNALAGYLNVIKANSNGLITEIFVMDNKGLNVGQTDKTGDYMQGDEAKWQQTYGNGPGALHISGVEADGGVNVTQVSLSITDPVTLSAIGAVTVGVDADKLE